MPRTEGSKAGVNDGWRKVSADGCKGQKARSALLGQPKCRPYGDDQVSDRQHEDHNSDDVCIRHCSSESPNVAAHGSRASDARIATDTQSRGPVQPVSLCGRHIRAGLISVAAVNQMNNLLRSSGGWTQVLAWVHDVPLHELARHFLPQPD